MLDHFGALLLAARRHESDWRHRSLAAGESRQGRGCLRSLHEPTQFPRNHFLWGPVPPSHRSKVLPEQYKRIVPI